MRGEALAILLVFTLQGPPAARPIPVVIYPVLDLGVDPPAADRLTQALTVAFLGDGGFTVVQRTPAAKSRAPRAQYGVLADLHPAGKSVHLLIRVVDIDSVYLVAFDSVTGARGDIEGGFPALAGKVAQRLRTLQTAPFAGGHPPSWRIATVALEAYARALRLGQQGDTAGAILLLREALRISPTYGEACEALRRLAVGPSCTPVR